MRYLGLLLLIVSTAFAGGQDAKNQKPVVVPPLVTFDPEHQKALSYSDAMLKVLLEVGKGHESLLITIRATGRETTVELPQELAQVNEIRNVVANKLAISGMVNASGGEIVIIDLTQAKIIDKFVCYNPSISPDGRFIAFIKFYPAHFSEHTEDHYMVYDIGKTPSENRPIGAAADDWRVVGTCVYPLDIGNESFDNLRRPHGSEHQSRSNFYWNDTEEEFFFADQVESSPAITLVIVEIHSTTKATVRTTDQDEEVICKKVPGTASNCLILVRNVQFKAGPTPSIILAFEIVSRQKLVSMDYVLSSFQ